MKSGRVFGPVSCNFSRRPSVFSWNGSALASSPGIAGAEDCASSSQSSAIRWNTSGASSAQTPMKYVRSPGLTGRGSSPRMK